MTRHRDVLGPILQQTKSILPGQRTGQSIAATCLEADE